MVASQFNYRFFFIFKYHTMHYASCTESITVFKNVDVVDVAKNKSYHLYLIIVPIFHRDEMRVF